MRYRLRVVCLSKAKVTDVFQQWIMDPRMTSVVNVPAKDIFIFMTTIDSSAPDISEASWWDSRSPTAIGS